jgi:ketosteroid isomerase-like protein
VLTGTAQAGRGVFTLVVERRPEGWRIVHDHTSVGPEPAPPAPSP